MKEGNVITVVDIECLDLLKSHRHQKHQYSRSCKSYHSLQLSSISGRVFQHGWQFGCKPFHATGAVLSQSTAFVNSTKAWTWSRPSPSAWSDASMVAQALVILPSPVQFHRDHSALSSDTMASPVSIFPVLVDYGENQHRLSESKNRWFSKQKPSFIVDFPTFPVDFPTFLVDFPTFLVDFPTFLVDFPTFLVDFPTFLVDFPTFLVDFPTFLVDFPTFLVDFLHF